MKTTLAGKRPAYSPSQSSFFHLHAHSSFSSKDALPSPEEMVRTVTRHGQPALALTDHGNMAGAVRLYKACRKAGILPFIGEEFYLVKEHRTLPRFHLNLVAYTLEGYHNLVAISSAAHDPSRFYHKPHISLNDLASLREQRMTNGIALLTGCHFGMVTQTMITQGEEAAWNLVNSLARWFPTTFVEIQRHKIEREGDEPPEEEVADALYSLATGMGLPVVVTNDSHYCELEDRPLHDTLKMLSSWSKDSPDDAIFPGSGFHLASADFVRLHHDPKHFAASLDSMQWLLDNHELSIPELDHYSYRVPTSYRDPQAELTKRVNVHSRVNTEYRERRQAELDVIAYTGMAGYLLLVAEFTDWMRSQAIAFSARGSASGSLLCNILGITQVDPLKYGLMFERFLSTDRTKPPDIDLDVQDDRRGECLEWLRSRFSTVQIGTWLKFGVDENTERGSLFVAYLSYLRKTGRTDEIVQTMAELPAEVRGALYALGESDSTKGYGVHAGGVVVAKSESDLKGVPTMYVASSKTTVSQYGMKDVEAMGLVKLDVLGLRTLNMLDKVQASTGRDMLTIPTNDSKTFALIRKGYTEGIFQLEGFTAARGCKEMKVSSLKDIIAIQALYRPAVMSSGGKDEYINRKFGSPWQRLNIHIEGILQETFGLFIFQEQVIQVLRFLEFSAEELTEFLGAVKASNKNVVEATRVIATYKGLFHERAEAHDLSEHDRDTIWKAIEGFGEYGFNKAHAVAYGLMSYRCAWYKTNYPLDFFVALLQTSVDDKDKQRRYMAEARRAGIRVLPAHVNSSGLTWTKDEKYQALRKGLQTIGGVGKVWAETIVMHAPYESVDDLIVRTKGARMIPGGHDWNKTTRDKAGVIKALWDSNALEGLAEIE